MDQVRLRARAKAARSLGRALAWLGEVNHQRLPHPPRAPLSPFDTLIMPPKFAKGRNQRQSPLARSAALSTLACPSSRPPPS